MSSPKAKKQKTDSVPLNDTDKKIFDWVDANLKTYVDKLIEVTNIPGISALPEKRQDIVKVTHLFKKWFEEVGGKAELRDIGQQDLGEGKMIDLPPVLFVKFGDDPNKPTVCIYGHMDVQPAVLEDGWDTEPFECTLKGETLFGRGTTDDKGPVVCWVAVFAAHKALGLDLPVNIKGVFEGMEEYGSLGLPELLKEESKPGKFLADVERTYICDNYWLGTDTPCLTYGLRGIAFYSVEVTMGTKDLHSGVHGGVVHEGMWDLCALLAKLVDPTTGEILVEGVNDQVCKMTDEEKALYDPIDFKKDEYARDVGFDHQTFVKPTKQTMLMNRWRYPSLSIHGIEGAFYGAGAKTVIPRKVIGKFSIRVVPDQTPDYLTDCVQKYLKKEFAKLNSPNVLSVKCIHGAASWLGDPTDITFSAASRATQKVWGKVPDMTREGGSIPVTLDFTQNTGKPACLLPIGASDDGAHSQNEKFDLKNMRNGIKTMALTLHEYATMAKNAGA